MFRILWIPGECKAFKETFMKCLRVSSFDNSKCRLQSKAYLECRMEQWVFNVLFLMKCWVNEIICLLSSCVAVSSWQRNHWKNWDSKTCQILLPDKQTKTANTDTAPFHNVVYIQTCVCGMWDKSVQTILIECPRIVYTMSNIRRYC